MMKKILDSMVCSQMFQSGDKVIVAVSGGADSVCLLYVLAKIREEWNIELRAVHVHHGLRGEEADKDALFTENFCKNLNVPCVVVHCQAAEYARKHGISVEEAGRNLRYEVFDQEARQWGANKIAVAHHGDDDAETILHNLFRGSGLKGIGGIMPVRGNIVRPLLGVSKKEIVYFLEKEGLSWCEDSTNQEIDYTRNKIRNQVIPLIISEINSGAVNNILRAGKMIAQADKYLEKKAAEILTQEEKTESGRIGLPVDILKKEDSIIQTYLIRQMINELSKSGKDITAKHVEQVQGLLKKRVGRSISLPYSLLAKRSYEYLWIENRQIHPDVDNQLLFDLPIPVFSVFPYEKGMEIPKNQYTKWFDYDKIKGTLSVRIRETGDFITLAAGGKKTVKAFMIDEKIPREKRNRIPLLADGNHALWIIGYRISEYYKVTAQTQMILQVQFDGGKNNGR